MYIQPNTTVKILRDIPLDESYENTIWFANANAQYTYFTGSSHVKYSFDTIPATYTYQRVNKNTIRVNVLADNLYDCNYLMFQNTAYGNKWFYCFIREVNYINDNVTEVVYSIDVLQTWAFEYELQECFVEREHSATDVVGDNLQDENLPTGDYVLGSDFSVPVEFTQWQVVICYAYDPATVTDPFPPSTGAFYNKAYEGCAYQHFTVNVSDPSITASVINSKIQTFQTIWGDRSDAIISIYMCPAFVPEDKNSITSGAYTHISKNAVQSGAVFDGYAPRNKKLYTYPYNYLYVTNFQDVSKAFPYEYFDYTSYGQGYSRSQVHFDISGNVIGQPSCVTYPKWYKESGAANLNEIMTVHGYPQGSFNTNAFKAWLAQIAGIGMAVAAGALAIGGAGLVGGALGGAMAGATGATSTALSAGGAVAGGASSGLGIIGSTAVATATGDLANAAKIAKPILSGIVGNKLREGVNAFKNPVEYHGQQNGNSLMQVNALGFAYGNRHIRGEYAQIIDQYFDMYGYACNKVKVPNTHVRHHWTYTKTIGAIVTGRIPKDAQDKICAIFNSGIRFWQSGSEIGKYSTYAPYNTPIV